MADQPKRRKANTLTAAKLGADLTPGKYHDGGGIGLYLRVEPNGSRFWVQRISVNGKRREIGLGSPPLVSLATARRKATANKQIALDGGDPLAEKRKGRGGLIFGDAMETFLAKKSAEFRNDKHRKQWRATLDTYAAPVLGQMQVQAIEVRDVLRVLEPIWLTKNETASRLRGRIEAVLSWATVAGHRTGDNPARWAGNLKELLPTPSKVAKADNHPALALSDVPRWWRELSRREGMAARALQFLTLTCARSGEVRGMTWGEVEFEPAPGATRATRATRQAVWTIPASRMKAGREHRVPLTPEAVAILREVAGAGDADDWQRPEAGALVFPAPRGGMLSDMTLSAVMRRIQEAEVKAGRDGFIDLRNKRPAVPHGLRSTFRDWAAERGHDRDMAEIALAHTVGSEVERAYRRSDMIERRRGMAEAWGRFIRGEDGRTVVALTRG
ncbi:site-specific integrase [Paenirhodobacter sp. CAU 1674]|uniref:tyrosine-type recombinase/integrase n=1 Tax=Paenirhodobacter sp. CAU 1674 TaxID=3032596 RepID=UPI0023DC1278|nr:site-specific integrase [Paenirhodobacter sp. CAU 1674]MDF2143143.1 tyrosine-type recombinase/integrase [Paenirhodobacter sp. CAU 1674]